MTRTCGLLDVLGISSITALVFTTIADVSSHKFHCVLAFFMCLARKLQQWEHVLCSCGSHSRLSLTLAFHFTDLYGHYITLSHSVSVDAQDIVLAFCERIQLARKCKHHTTCTRADAHFSRAHLTVHVAYSTALFQCVHTALAQGGKEFVSRVRLHSFPSRLPCHYGMFRLSVFFQSCTHLHARLPGPQRPQRRWVAVDKTFVLPLPGVECLAALPF